MSKINGHPIGSTIVPTDTADVYATHTEQYGQGGYRTVETIAERDAITLNRLKVGMKVLVRSEKNIYYLKSLDNDTPVWQLDTFLYSDQLLVTPQLQRTWTFYKSDGTTEVAANAVNKNNNAIKATDSNVTIEAGFVARYVGQFIWNSYTDPNDPTKDKKNPTTCSGDLGTKLPADGVWSTSTTINGIKVPDNSINYTKTIKETITAPKKGFMVSGSSVVVAQGTDSTSAQDSINFRGRYYYGNITNKAIADVTQDDIKALTSSNLTDKKGITVTINTKTDNVLFMYAYPKAYGNLTSAVQDGAIPILSAFNSKEIDVVNDAGATIRYIVYINTNLGVFNNNKVVFG